MANDAVKKTEKKKIISTCGDALLTFYGIDSFDADTGIALRHGEYIDDSNGKFIYKVSKHETHDFHGHTGPAMSKHLEEGEGGALI
ncbi:predicted protein [Histoplasma mississippiense (nom. inval.)]|uniref:predicted protein n=1 Tax=Ajellomyces capsulatus (strain NAm1 / WU24) TaxID=2059318 RepID=UPI000157C704|nr:predicted protein [Histoplasma mississippiense (nom. inval.)]EDN08853.1 predicted protein [Histoplasma mississippiense (nom. inval.)]